MYTKTFLKTLCIHFFPEDKNLCSIKLSIFELLFKKKWGYNSGKFKQHYSTNVLSGILI